MGEKRSIDLRSLTNRFKFDPPSLVSFSLTIPITFVFFDDDSNLLFAKNLHRSFRLSIAFLHAVLLQVEQREGSTLARSGSTLILAGYIGVVLAKSGRV